MINYRPISLLAWLMGFTRWSRDLRWRQILSNLPLVFNNRPAQTDILDRQTTINRRDPSWASSRLSIISGASSTSDKPWQLTFVFSDSNLKGGTLGNVACLFSEWRMRRVSDYRGLWSGWYISCFCVKQWVSVRGIILAEESWQSRYSFIFLTWTQ